MKSRILALFLFILIMLAGGCGDSESAELCACAYAGYYGGEGNPPAWYWGNTHLVIEILEESGKKKPYGQHGFAPTDISETDPHYHDWVEYYYIGYYIDVIMTSHAIYLPVLPEIFIPDFLADEIKQSDKWLIETSRLGTFDGKQCIGLKRSLYTNDYSYKPMLPVTDDKIVFTEQFGSLISDWFDPDISNYDIIETPAAYLNLAFAPLWQPPLTAPVFETIIAYNEQVLRGDWVITLGTCDLHRREFRVNIEDKIFYDGMSLDELREYFDALTRATAQVGSTLSEIDAHLKMLFSLVD
jgi:hypothetical protein